MRVSEFTRDGPGVSGDAGAEETWGVPPSVKLLWAQQRHPHQREAILNQRAFWIR